MTDRGDELLGRVVSSMARVFRIPSGYVVTRDTTAADIDGWDSLSHSMLIMNVEEEFGLELPLDELFALDNVGELLDLIARIRRPATA